MSPAATAILDSVMDALQPAEELGAPEGREYTILMALIAEECLKRIRIEQDNREAKR